MIAKRVLVLLPLLMLAATAATAQDNYPSRPIRLVHGFAAGGNADVVARIVANELSRSLGQSVVVEPRPGAGGNAASAFVTKSAPDGYTIQLMVGGHTVSAALYKSLPFDPVNHYAFISTIGRFPFFIATRAGTFSSLKELVAKAKAKSGGLNFGSSGVGTTQHLTGELLALQTGTRLAHIPYQGGSAAATAVLRGDVDLIIDTGTVISGQVAAGRFDALGVSSKDRWADAPKVPTVAETIAPEFDIISWTGLAAPAGTPVPAVNRPRTELHRALALPEVRERLRALESEPYPSTGEEMLDLVKRQIANWTRVVKETGLEKR